MVGKTQPSLAAFVQVRLPKTTGKKELTLQHQKQEKFTRREKETMFREDGRGEPALGRGTRIMVPGGKQ